MGRREAVADVHRSFGLVGHRASGKTTLAEMLLSAAGVVRSPGSVERGTALLDYEPDERRRRVGVWSSLAWLPWQVGESMGVLHIVDTPGGVEHAHVRRMALSGADLEVLVLSVADGIEHGADEVLRRTRHDDRPLMVVLNKLDQPHEDPALLREELIRRTGRRLVHLTLPVRSEEDGSLEGVVDVLGNRVLRYDPEGSGAWSAEPIPTPLQGRVQRAKEAIFEAAALADDTLLEQYLEYFELPVADAWRGLRRALDEGAVLPSVHTCAAQCMGAETLLDAEAALAPDPAEWVLPGGVERAPSFVAQWIGTRLDDEGRQVSLLRVWSGQIPRQAWLHNSRTGSKVRSTKLYRVRGPRRAVAKTASAGCIVATWDPLPGVPGDAFTDGPSVPLQGPEAPPQMAWLAVQTPGKPEDLTAGLQMIRRIDPSVVWREEELGDGYRLAGTTASQLHRATEILSRRLHVPIEVGLPPVHYLERPAGEVRDVHGLYCRTSHAGEVSEYGECWLDLRPLPTDVPWRFFGEVDEDMLPRRFVSPIENGALRALKRGPTAGYPVQGVEVRCARGEYDALESEPEHFEQAGELAMAAALEEAGTELYEPWSEVLLYAPSEQVGAVLSDLSAHRGRVVGMEVDREETSIQASCPERELQELGARLQAMTAGRAWFVARRSHYDRLPSALVGDVVANSPFRVIASDRFLARDRQVG